MRPNSSSACFMLRWRPTTWRRSAASKSARALYRGDYLDDCPLYGDSEFVEERQGFLRARLVDALVGLGQRYEVRGDNLLAAARLREALAVSGGDCKSAVAGLQRLGVAEG